MITLITISGGSAGNVYGDIYNTDLYFGSGGAGATTTYGAGKCYSYTTESFSY